MKWGCLPAKFNASVSTLQPPTYENFQILKTNKSSTQSAPELLSRTTRVFKSSDQIDSAWGYKNTEGSIAMGTVGNESSEGDTPIGRVKFEENLEGRKGNGTLGHEGNQSCIYVTDVEVWDHTGLEVRIPTLVD